MGDKLSIMRRELPEAYYHATPLHYAPHLLRTGILYSQRQIKALGLPVRPRPTAEKRDRKLGLDRFVHLAFEPVTPLLADKLLRRMPHVLVEFAPSVMEREGAALVRYNAKAWRHREDFTPVFDASDKAVVLEGWQTGKYPSVELLISDRLPLLPEARTVHTATGAEFLWLLRLITGVGLPTIPPVRLSPDRFPALEPPDLGPQEQYAAACLALGELLPPPDLPFD